MVEPLTDGWIEALAAAAHGRNVPNDVSLVVEYRVDDGPTWHLVVADGAARVVAGPANEPDAAFRTDRTTALALTDGSMDPLRAVINGDLAIHGDPRALVAAQGLLDDLGGLLAPAQLPSDDG
ncbi:MAG: SCP2 sterol-binding domain-containing protein [Actinomycetota bacterium]|nr:SCP2 sterol-binding domain-containing protein [Actinomycetota bacterium]MED6328039.1 SCP2 sterol-binding domain-containing protein [Actinomycetota bacterium]MEE2957910.1 SCP2 sterol-binding domain-containing protein [Actinomycetota bacterium]